MAQSTGIFNTTINPTELNARSFASKILRQFPNGAAPMFALSSQSGRSKAKSSTHGYFSKTMSFIRQAPAAQVLAAAETISVASTTGMVIGMVLYNARTRENVRITSIISSTVIGVSRAFGRVAAAQMETTDYLIQVGTAHEEGSTRPVARRITTVYVPNYTQIFRNAWALTGTAAASMAEMGYNNVAEDKQECAMFHSVDIETAIIWGQPKMDTSGATPVHATQGVIDAMEQYCPGNTNAASSTTTYEQLIALLEPAYTYSTNLGDAVSRIAFCDNTAMKVLNEIGRKSGQLNMTGETTYFGMRFNRFEFYQGTVNLVIHPLFNGLVQTGNMLVMDMSALKLAYLDGRDTKPTEYGMDGKPTDNGVDAVGGDLLTELAVELINPYACAWVTGLTAGAASS